MGRRGEQQLQVNLQFNDELAKVKTKQMHLAEALGASVRLMDELLDRLVERKVLHPEDYLIEDFRRAIDLLQSQGMRFEVPDDPDAPPPQVKCPGCEAVIKIPPMGRVERCDWCGHVFPETD